jgi:hypothetical protein
MSSTPGHLDLKSTWTVYQLELTLSEWLSTVHLSGRKTLTAWLMNKSAAVNVMPLEDFRGLMFYRCYYFQGYLPFDLTCHPRVLPRYRPG